MEFSLPCLIPGGYCAIYRSTFTQAKRMAPCHQSHPGHRPSPFRWILQLAARPYVHIETNKNYLYSGMRTTCIHIL